MPKNGLDLTELDNIYIYNVKQKSLSTITKHKLTN